MNQFLLFCATHFGNLGCFLLTAPLEGRRTSSETENAIAWTVESYAMTYYP